MRCKVSNGFAEIGDVVTFVSYGNEARYLYKVMGFQKYDGAPQIRYRKVIPATWELFPDTADSWMDFSDALIELKIIHKHGKR